MPKPIFGINGSGMHTNQSLFNADGTNAFFDPNGPLQLSDIAYKRLVLGYEAPVYVAWSAPTARR